MNLNAENHAIALLNRTRGQTTIYRGTSIGTYEQSDINCCFGKKSVFE